MVLHNRQILVWIDKTPTHRPWFLGREWYLGLLYLFNDHGASIQLYLLQGPHVTVTGTFWLFLEGEDKEITLFIFLKTFLANQKVQVWLEYHPIFKWLDCDICKKQEHQSHPSLIVLEFFSPYFATSAPYCPPPIGGGFLRGNDAKRPSQVTRKPPG